MKYNINLSPPKKKILLILVKEDIKPDTLLSIESDLCSRFGLGYNNTYKFLLTLSKKGFLVVTTSYSDYDRQIINGMKNNNGRLDHVYRVNKKNIIEYFQNSWEYIFSKELEDYKDDLLKQLDESDYE